MLAHHPHQLSPGVRVLPPGRQPPGDGPDVHQYHGHLPGQRLLARGRVDLFDLGRPPRSGAGHRAGLGALPGPPAPAGALGSDVPLREHRLGLLPGPGPFRRRRTAAHRPHRGPCQAGALAAGVPVLQGDGGAANAPARPDPLDEHFAGGGALRRGHGDGPLAPEHHLPHGQLPPHLLAGRGADGGDGVVRAVLYGHHHLYLFQFLRRPL